MADSNQDRMNNDQGTTVQQRASASGLVMVAGQKIALCLKDDDNLAAV